MQVPSSRRRWLHQYGLRTLLLLAVLENIALGCIVVRMQNAERQRQAREILQTAHWGVLHQFMHDSDFDFVVPPRQPGPQWLRDIFGVDFLSNVTWVRVPDLEHGAILNTDLDCLACFPRLERLDLECRATDGVLMRLRGMKSLAWLDARQGTVTDVGLRNLEELTAVRFLFLTNTPITDAGLEYLKGLTELSWLDLERTRITDAGLQQLKRLTMLSWLGLQSTQISDAGLGNLRDLGQLRHLDLSNTQISDKGLEPLKALTRLDSLYLCGTHVTQEGVRALEQALPDCSVHWDKSD